MSIKMIKQLLATSVICAFATSAMAADGTINFTGEITSASCVVSPGAGTVGEKQVIDVNLGKVSMDSLGSGGSTGIVAGTSINLNLDCGNTGDGLSTVSINFDPLSGTGIDPSNSSLLKTQGTAKGVGIGLYNTDNTLLNLSGNQSFDSALVHEGDKYTAKLNLRAAYVANGETVVAGPATGTLPFTLTYK